MVLIPDFPSWFHYSAKRYISVAATPLSKLLSVYELASRYEEKYYVSLGVHVLAEGREASYLH